MPMMSMSKSCKPNNVNHETKDTDDQELIQPVQLLALPQSFESIENDFYTD